MLESDHPLFQPRKLVSQVETKAEVVEWRKIGNRDHLTSLFAQLWYRDMQATTHGVHSDGGRLLHIRPDQAGAPRSIYSGAKELSTRALCGELSEHPSLGVLPEPNWRRENVNRMVLPHICKQCLDRFEKHYLNN